MSSSQAGMDKCFQHAWILETEARHNNMCPATSHIWQSQFGSAIGGITGVFDSTDYGWWWYVCLMLSVVDIICNFGHCTLFFKFKSWIRREWKINVLFLLRVTIYFLFQGVVVTWNQWVRMMNYSWRMVWKAVKWLRSLHQADENTHYLIN